MPPSAATRPRRRSPPRPFNVVISGRRSFACVEVGLDEAKAIARAAEATINDVVLAAVSGALRAWLVGRECLPAAPLYAGVPVSVRARRGDRARHPGRLHRGEPAHP
jgi:diacylglycerol O-acyltransferase / wax synthase